MRLESECQVLVYRHVRIERVVLKNHRQISLTGIHTVHKAVSNPEFSVRDILQSGDHAQHCGFSAAGRTDKYNEFVVSDLQIKILDRLESVAVGFRNVR